MKIFRLVPVTKHNRAIYYYYTSRVWRDEDFRAKVLIVSTSHCVSTKSRAHVDFYLLYYFLKIFTVHTKLLWTKKKERKTSWKIADQGPETYVNNDSGAFSLASQTAIQHAHETWDISKKTWHIVKPDLLQQVSGREETLPFWIVAYERSVLALTSQKNLKKLFFFAAAVGLNEVSSMNYHG